MRLRRWHRLRIILTIIRQTNECRVAERRGLPASARESHTTEIGGSGNRHSWGDRVGVGRGVHIDRPLPLGDGRDAEPSKRRQPAACRHEQIIAGGTPLRAE